MSNTISFRPDESHTAQPDNEAAWVAAAKGGYVSAFEELVHRNERRVFRLAMHITQNQEDAEDVTQGAFIKAYQHLDEFRGDSRFSTWLVRITVNEALQKLRKRHPNRVAFDEPIQSDDGLIPHEVEDWGDNPEKRYSRTELREIIAEAVGNLAPALRVVFLLRDIENLSTEETGQMLKLSVPAVKSRLLRARLKLRERLNRYFRRASNNRDRHRVSADP
jgi:RNA polymerase sigma-70 factor (ECF subfamily)